MSNSDKCGLMIMGFVILWCIGGFVLDIPGFLAILIPLTVGSLFSDAGDWCTENDRARTKREIWLQFWGCAALMAAIYGVVLWKLLPEPNPYGSNEIPALLWGIFGGFALVGGLIALSFVFDKRAKRLDPYYPLREILDNMPRGTETTKPYAFGSQTLSQSQIMDPVEAAEKYRYVLKY